MTEADRRRYGCRTTEELRAATETAAEKAIQRTVENWLRLRGYWPRTDAFLTGAPPPRGWYVHLARPRGNPYLLDLLVWTLAGRALEIELKTPTGRLRPEQEAILAAGGCVRLCRGEQEAIDAIKTWETEDARVSSSANELTNGMSDGVQNRKRTGNKEGGKNGYENSHCVFARRSEVCAN